MFRVLCLDGGGIRGVYTASFLAHLEEEIWEKRGETNHDAGVLHECFDMVVGTSTGGIIALAIAFGVPMQKVVQLYSDRAKIIFPSGPLSGFTSFFTRPFFSKYSNEALIRELKAVFGSETKFDQPSCHTRIQAYDLLGGRSRIFRAGGSYREYRNFFIWQVAAATSAAPTYFPTFEMGDKGVFVDGGLWANNPSVVGIGEALRLGADIREIKLLSVGTGAKVARSPKKRSGLISWFRYFVDTTFHSHGDGMHQLAEGCKLGFYKRVEEILGPSESSLDATGAVNTLIRMGGDKYQLEKQDLLIHFSNRTVRH